MNSNEFSQIVPVNRISKESFHELPKGLVVSNKSQYVTVDSGACDSIVPQTCLTIQQLSERTNLAKLMALAVVKQSQP